MTFWQKLKGFRTYIMAAIVAALGVLETTPWVDLLPVEWQGVGLIVIGSIFAFLRMFTNTPAGKAK